MMAITPTFVDGRLAITSDAASDTILVTAVDEGGIPSVRINGLSVGPGVRASDVTSIFAELGGGADTMDLTTLDMVTFSGLTDSSITINGGAGRDTIAGTVLADILNGNGGDDEIRGHGGDDAIEGGPGADTIYGDDGNDTIYGRGGDDRIFGGDGDDDIRGGTESDELYGDGGSDVLRGGEGPDFVYGGDGNDRLIGGNGDDSLAGGADNDGYVFPNPLVVGFDTIHELPGEGTDRLNVKSLPLVGPVNLDSTEVQPLTAGQSIQFVTAGTVEKVLTPTIAPSSEGVYTVPGAPDETTPVTFRYAGGNTPLFNRITYYEVDADGYPLHTQYGPDDPLFDPLVPMGGFSIERPLPVQQSWWSYPRLLELPFAGGTRLAFFLERDDGAGGTTRFYSMPTMNVDGNHVHVSSNNDTGETIFSWEDLSRTQPNPLGLEYDGDFDDVILAIGSLTSNKLAPAVWVKAGEQAVNEDGSQSLSFTFTNMGSDGVNPFEPYITQTPLIVPFSEGPLNTATAGEDYSGLPGGSGTYVTVIPAGEHSVTVTLTLINDDLLEGDETIEFYPVTTYAHEIGYGDGSTYPGGLGYGGELESRITTILDDEKVDLDVDSDNTGPVDRTPSEEVAEQIAGRPGQILAVGGARAPMVWTLKAGVTADLALTAGADKVNVWTSSQPGQGHNVFEGRSTVPMSEILDLFAEGQQPLLWVEAIAPSLSAADIAFTLTGSGGTHAGTDTDTVRFTAAEVDLDVNSDNVGGATLDPGEDAIEDIVDVDATPGLYLQVQDEDADGDGLVNWADGFDGLGSEISDDDSSDGAAFEPIYFQIPEWVYATNATLEVFYSASAPSAEVMDPHYLSWDRPTDGHLRLWTKDAAIPRNHAAVQDGGDFVATSSAEEPLRYTLADLNLVPGINVLFLEAIRESTRVGEQRITFRLTPRLNGQPAPFTLEDSVRVTTARIEVMADNRDGTAQFPTFGLTATRMPNPNAGLSGLVPELTQAYTINVYDPRGPETIHTIYVAGTPLSLTPAGTGRYTTADQFMPVPVEDLPLIDADEPVDGLLGGPLYPSDVIDGATVVPVYGTSVQIRYNGETTLPVFKPEGLEAARKLMEELANEVAPGMASFLPDDAAGNSGRIYNPLDPGALGTEYEARINDQRLAIVEDASQPEKSRAFARQLRANISLDEDGIVLNRQPNTTGSAQLDFIFVKEGYEPTVGLPIERNSYVTFEVRATPSGTLARGKIATREAFSAYSVAVVDCPWRSQAIRGTDGVITGYKVVSNNRVKATASFMRLVGAKAVKLAPYAPGVALLVTNMSSETWAAEDEILIEMVRLGHIDTENERHTFGEKLMDWYRNRFGDEGFSQLGISVATYANTDDFRSLVEQWNENLPNMYESIVE